MKEVFKTGSDIILYILLAISLFKVVKVLIMYVRLRMKKGIITYAEVLDVTEKDYSDADGTHSIIYDCLVRYTTEEGEIITAYLVNGKHYLQPGQMIKVKYLPDDKENPLLIKDRSNNEE